MPLIVRLVGLLAFTLCVAPASSRSQAPSTADGAIVLITLDGARIEEIFGGLDEAVLRSTLRDQQRLEEQPVYRRFHAPTREARRAALMPFFWNTLMARHGSIAGDRSLGSSVTLANRHRFSYPGYAEILLGEAHDAVIDSNDARRNPWTTVLEEVQAAWKLPAARAAVFASWEVFDAIVEHREGAMTVNAGYEAFDHADPQVRALSERQFRTLTPWNSVRHDEYTFRFAMAHLASARPRLLYLALGETDDWAHDGRYDRVLEAYARTDRYLEELWTWLQNQRDYRDRTHLLITTDHGRGRTPKDWRNHGAEVEGAQDVWIALVSPAMSGRGVWRDHPSLRTNQVAATLARWAGIDWNQLRPAAGDPLP